MKRLLTSKQMDDFCKAYPCTSNRELAARFGLSGMQVSNLASRRKLKKDAGYHGRILGELIKAERARIFQGLPQLTKMRLTLRPRRLYHAASWLLKKNYMIDYDYRIAYYDDKTSRGRWEDTELMSPQRRQWIMKKVMEKLDHRYLETVVGAIADKYGDLLCDDDMEADIYLHVV